MKKNKVWESPPIRYIQSLSWLLVPRGHKPRMWNLATTRYCKFSSFQLWTWGTRKWISWTQTTNSCSFLISVPLIRVSRFHLNSWTYKQARKNVWSFLLIIWKSRHLDMGLMVYCGKTQDQNLLGVIYINAVLFPPKYGLRAIWRPTHGWCPVNGPC